MSTKLIPIICSLLRINCSHTTISSFVQSLTYLLYLTLRFSILCSSSYFTLPPMDITILSTENFLINHGALFILFYSYSIFNLFVYCLNYCRFNTYQSNYFIGIIKTFHICSQKTENLIQSYYT